MAADDRLEILDVIARYSHAADSGDPAAFDAVLTGDAILEVKGKASYEGLAAIKEQLVAEVAARGGQTRRHVRNTVFDELDGDHARTKSYYFLTLVPSGGRPTPLATGVYEDELVRTGDGWRIARRLAQPDVSGEAEPRA